MKQYAIYRSTGISYSIISMDNSCTINNLQIILHKYVTASIKVLDSTYCVVFLEKGNPYHKKKP